MLFQKNLPIIFTAPIEFCRFLLYLIYIMTKKIITLNEVKRNNLRSVLDLLLRSDGLSRIEIAGKLGCDNTTVSRAVKELIDRKIIYPGSKNGSNNGRPRVALQVNPDGPLLLGIALEPDGISGVLTDLKSKPLRVEKIRFRNCSDQQEYLATAVEIIEKLQFAAKEKLAGIGVTVFGSYHGVDAVLEKAAALPILNGVKLQPFFNGCTNKEVIICDHSVALATFLTRREAELTTGDVMLINVGKGLGVVLLRNGKKLFNRNNHGGEFGHIIRIPDGEKCACGRRGCLETLVSTPALIKKYRELTGKNISLEKLASEFCSNLPDAEKVIAPAIDILSTAIAEQLNNYPVDTLAISGDILKFGTTFCKRLQKNITDLLFSLSKENLKFHFPEIDSADALAIGASMLAAENYVAAFDRIIDPAE